MKSVFISLCVAFLPCVSSLGMNPYLPLWEHIPDGEPYVFDDPDCPGKKRVYIYGSHDMLRDKYCGTDLVVWSAPVDSLESWRYDGVIFESKRDANGNLLHEDGRGDVLYAPDVALRILPDGKKEYYLYPNNQEGGRNGMAARSDRPDGPFEVINWNPENCRETIGLLGFDPAVFVDEDGRVYGYWGWGKSYAAELDPATMSTLKPGCEVVEDMVTPLEAEGDGHFYEASSSRKIGDKYVFVYSRMSPEGEFGLPQSNYTLAYAYGDNPLGPYTYGGVIIDGRGRDTDACGNSMATATPNGNTHGGIVEINGRWWVFYHRQTGLDEYARQAMVAPIEVAVTPGAGGKVVITEGEYTSEGFETSGLDPFRRYPAAIASHFTGPTAAYQTYPAMNYSGPYFEPSYVENHDIADPYREDINVNKVVNNTAGSILGYKYFNFDGFEGCESVSLVLDMIPESVGGKIAVYTSAPWKGDAMPVGEYSLPSGLDAGKSEKVVIPLHNIEKLRGKHPVYLTFDSSEKGKSICSLTHIQFKCGN